MALTGPESACRRVPDPMDLFRLTSYLSGYFLNEFVLNGTALAGQDIIFLSPGDPVTLASYMISPTAIAGTVSGTISIYCDIYDGNPFDANTFRNWIDSDVFDVNTAVTAAILEGGGNGPGPVAPEPGTVVMCLTGLASLIVLHRRRQKAYVRTDARSTSVFCSGRTR